MGTGESVGEVKPFYENEKDRISIIPNPHDGPDGYYVNLGKDSFVIPSRVLESITDETSDPENAVRGLDNATSGQCSYILGENGMTPDQLYRHLQAVRIKALEEQLSDAYRQLRDAQNR